MQVKAEGDDNGPNRGSNQQNTRPRGGFRGGLGRDDRPRGQEVCAILFSVIVIAASSFILLLIPATSVFRTDSTTSLPPYRAPLTICPHLTRLRKSFQAGIGCILETSQVMSQKKRYLHFSKSLVKLLNCL